tara:strand:+ start:470 stop:1333 length:864 start_codon:yes stop_codon:yes gene_type:complete
MLMIIWLASYPKSGNTWVRSLISSYYFSKDNFKLSDLKKIPNFSVGDFIEDKELLKNNFDVAAQWLNVQKTINKKYQKTLFFKTHNACVSIKNNNFTDYNNSLGCIYIVRDPRNVITSYKNFEGRTYEEILNIMTNRETFLYSTKRFENKFGFKGFEFMGSWADHYNTWVKNKLNIPICLVKYENLVNDALGELERMIKFIASIQKVNDFKFDPVKAKIALEQSSFENLSRMENEEGFNEIPEALKKKNKFFNLGEKNNWEKLLPSHIKQSIEKDFDKELKELEYIV